MSDSARGKHATALILVGFVLVFGTSPVNASSLELAGNSAAGDWLYVDHDLAGTRCSSLDKITTKNVSRLAKACEYTFPDKEPSQTAPIVSGGRLYLTTARYTVAIDGADCRVIWSSTWTPHGNAALNTHRGAALADGTVIRGTNDGYLLALDAKNMQRQLNRDTNWPLRIAAGSRTEPRTTSPGEATFRPLERLS